MAWTVEWDERAVREAKKLGQEARRRIVTFLRERIATEEDPRRIGKPLLAERAGLWRYRVGDYRVVCRIEDARVVVLVLAVGHRSRVYQ
ncbi:MAG: type II toxin-antitoxin system RelE/ParE family toxin [Armatimonadota bacterium]|nr:type II toxin-antitoxin system RelE/ParE family toxin [Armatimonadota bacterium]